MRTCSTCAQTLDESEFYADRRTKSGLTRRCRTCHSRKSYESRLRSDKPHARRDYDRALRIRRNFGITIEDYERMEQEQEGVCAICRKPEESRWSAEVPFTLAVDHDHATGKVRGLLCGQCNTGLGKFKDDPELLRAAIAYLDNCCEGEPQ